MIVHGIDNVGTLFPHDRPVKKGGNVAEPTTAQRKMFAKMGIAMPDGSYYIRNGAELDDAIKAVGRATPNAGESDVARRNSVRKHIRSRAAALHLSNKIPNTWNSDGSLKQSALVTGQAFVEHFGTKGMHWGVRNDSTSGGVGKRSALIEKAKAHEAVSVAHAKAAAHTQREAEDLATRGQHSDVFKRVYGKDAPNVGPNQFYFRTGQSKQQALLSTEENLRLLHNQYVHSANRHAKKAGKLRDKASRIQIQPVTHADVADILQHFGVKGMHWGVRNSTPGSADHERAQAVGHLIKSGGVRSASNEELQTLITRLNLESQHARLTAQPSRVEAGHNFIKKALGITKTGLDVVNTAQRVATTVSDAQDFNQRRQRNKPLKVVRIGN